MMHVFRRWRLMTMAVATAVTMVAVPTVLSAQSTVTVDVGGNGELGEFLVAGNGMTLYIFTPDELGVSNCTGGCATAWPPLTVADGETPTLGAGVSGELSLITRDDSSLQVALNGAAPYFSQGDSVPGDSNGQDVNDVWFVVDSAGAIVQMPAAAPTSPAAPVAGTTGNAGLISSAGTTPLVVLLLLVGAISLVFVGRRAGQTW